MQANDVKQFIIFCLLSSSIPTNLLSESHFDGPFYYFSFNPMSFVNLVVTVFHDDVSGLKVMVLFFLMK